MCVAIGESIGNVRMGPMSHRERAGSLGEGGQVTGGIKPSGPF